MTQGLSMDISMIYIALSGLLMVGLAVDVVRGRLKYQVGLGDGGHEALGGRELRLQWFAGTSARRSVGLLSAVACVWFAQECRHIPAALYWHGRYLEHDAGFSRIDSGEQLLVPDRVAML